MIRYWFWSQFWQLMGLEFLRTSAVQFSWKTNRQGRIGGKIGGDQPMQRFFPKLVEV
jgi:hypothetical protein